MVITEQQGRKGRRQRQGIEGRNHCRDGDGDGELLVEHPAQSADEGRGNEHGTQDQGGGDDRPRHLVHRAPGGVHRRQPQGDVPLHILHHHDGVIDHDADGQHQTEQGERIN